MTRDGLVEENLSDKSTVKLSRRTGDVKMERKSHRGKEEYVESPRSAQQSRDAPESGKKRQVQYKNASDQLVKELETDQAHFANDSGKQKNRKNAQRLRTERKRLLKENYRNGSIKPYTPAGEIPEKKKLVEPNVQNRKNGYSLLKKRQVLQIWKRKQKKWCHLKRKRQKHISIGSRCSHSRQKILGKRSGCTLRGKIPQKNQ